MGSERGVSCHADQTPYAPATEVALSLDHRILSRCLAKPLGAELRRPLERFEVEVDQSEAVAEAGVPLEVVLRAPVEVSVHRHALGGCPLELSKASAQAHDQI